MVRALLVLLLVALLPATASTQAVRDHEGEGGLRSFHGPGSGGRIKRSFQSDAEARAEFDRILAAIGLSPMADRITLRASAETNGAVAYIGPGDERLILYNAAFMQRIKLRTADHWSLVSVLAHEVGHHLAWHTMMDGYDHKFELEADRFSGFVLRRLGATLDHAQAAMRLISPKEASSTHPGLEQRLQAITLGWTDGGTEGAPKGLKGSTDPPPSPAALTAPPSGVASASPGPGSCIEVGSRIPGQLVVQIGSQVCDSRGRGRAIIRSMTAYSISYSVEGRSYTCLESDPQCTFAWDDAPRFRIDVVVGERPEGRRALLFPAR